MKTTKTNYYLTNLNSLSFSFIEHYLDSIKKKLWLSGKFLSLFILLFNLCLISKAQTKQWPEEDYKTALGFFQNGGSYSTRLITNSKADSSKTWTILILCPASCKKTTFGLGEADISGKASATSAMKFMEIFDSGPEGSKEFLRRYADLIPNGTLTGRLLLVPPLKDSNTVGVKASVSLTKKGLLDLLK
jgi:hypothetical protein